MGEIERVAGAGEVVVVARLVGLAGDSRKCCRCRGSQGGAEVIALGGMVIDHVEDDLDVGVVQTRDRGAKSCSGVSMA